MYGGGIFIGGGGGLSFIRNNILWETQLMQVEELMCKIVG